MEAFIPGSGGKSFKLASVDGNEREDVATAADNERAGDVIDDADDFESGCVCPALEVFVERMFIGDIKPRAASNPSTPVGVAAAAATAVADLEVALSLLLLLLLPCLEP